MFDASHIAVLLLGLLCAGVGGELFVRGAVGLSLWLRVPAGIVGATIAAFATSSPEASVAISSAWEGRPSIALGDALGSNIVNVALILGVALVVTPLKVDVRTIRREYFAALAAPILTAVLLVDGVISRVDGAVLGLLFATWMVFLVVEVRKQRSAAQKVLGSKGWHTLAFCLGGLALLAVAGRAIVFGAVGIAEAFGLSPFVIGATLVSFGTSVPELATVIISKLKGHDEIGLGTILGSNLFNNLFIVAIAATITPIAAPLRSVAVAVVFGALSVAATHPRASGVITRTQGLILLALYVAYMIETLVGVI